MFHGFSTAIYHCGQVYFFLKFSPFHKNQAVNLQTILQALHIRFYNLFIVLGLTFFTNKMFAQSVADHHLIAISAQDSTKAVLKVPFTLQQDNYVKDLTFFCRQEWKLEKALKLPLRFRVGSLEQCNKLEGKKY